MKNILGFPTPNSSRLAEILFHLKDVTGSNPDGGNLTLAGSVEFGNEENVIPSAINLQQEQHDGDLSLLQQQQEQQKLQEQLHQHMQQQEQQQNKPEIEEAETCNCKKSKCLKLYCQCFAAQTVCASSCKCISCENDDANNASRLEAIKVTLERNPNAFDSKYRPTLPYVVSSVAHKIGCRCRKSMCLKKYCECFQGSVMCSSICTCLTCHNNAEYFELNGGQKMAAAAKRDVPPALSGASVHSSSSQQPMEATLFPHTAFSSSSSSSVASSSSSMASSGSGENSSSAALEMKTEGRRSHDTEAGQQQQRDGLASKMRPPLSLPLKRKFDPTGHNASSANTSADTLHPGAVLSFAPPSSLLTGEGNDMLTATMAQYGLIAKSSPAPPNGSGYHHHHHLLLQTTPAGGSRAGGGGGGGSTILRSPIFAGDNEDTLKQKILENLLYKELESQGLVTATPGGGACTVNFPTSAPRNTNNCKGVGGTLTFDRHIDTPSSAAVARFLGSMYYQDNNNSGGGGMTMTSSSSNSSSNNISSSVNNNNNTSHTENPIDSSSDATTRTAATTGAIGTAIVTADEKDLSIEEANLASYNTYTRRSCSSNGFAISSASPNSISIAAALTLLSQNYLATASMATQTDSASKNKNMVRSSSSSMSSSSNSRSSSCSDNADKREEEEEDGRTPSSRLAQMNSTPPVVVVGDGLVGEDGEAAVAKTGLSLQQQQQQQQQQQMVAEVDGNCREDKINDLLSSPPVPVHHTELQSSGSGSGSRHVHVPSSSSSSSSSSPLPFIPLSKFGQHDLSPTSIVDAPAMAEGYPPRPGGLELLARQQSKGPTIIGDKNSSSSSCWDVLSISKERPLLYVDSVDDRSSTNPSRKTESSKRKAQEMTQITGSNTIIGNIGLENDQEGDVHNINNIPVDKKEVQ